MLQTDERGADFAAAVREENDHEISGRRMTFEPLFSGDACSPIQDGDVALVKTFDMREIH